MIPDLHVRVYLYWRYVYYYVYFCVWLLKTRRLLAIGPCSTDSFPPQSRLHSWRDPSQPYQTDPAESGWGTGAEGRRLCLSRQTPWWLQGLLERRQARPEQSPQRADQVWGRTLIFLQKLYPRWDIEMNISIVTWQYAILTLHWVIQEYVICGLTCIIVL